jgi:adenosylmethionine-8-amino-7-oxononanoate aminotransferase
MKPRAIIKGMVLGCFNPVVCVAPPLQNSDIQIRQIKNRIKSELKEAQEKLNKR